MNRKVMVWATLAALLTAISAPLNAQDQIEPPATSAIDDWSASVDEEGAVDDQGEIELDDASKKSIRAIDAYFNAMIHLQGRFIQTDSNKKETKGYFYVHRPGRLRFEYAQPSLLRIVADGQYLSIEDHDLKTVDKYPLESTPFRMLLDEDVDLIRDARIMAYVHEAGTIEITLEDRSGESAGQIKLLFDAPQSDGEIELKEWVITDIQGLDTRIQVADLEKGKEVSSDLFHASEVEFPEFAN